MPTKFHLSTEMNNQEMFVLNCSFLHNYDDILAEDYKVKVILPEGATNIQVHLPFGIDSKEESLDYSTLDFQGRPVVTLSKKNVISELHGKNFQVTYTYTRQAQALKFFYMIAFLFACLMTPVIMSRVNMSFETSKKIKKE